MGKSFVHHKNPVLTGIETYTEKNLPSESYSAVDYRIGRIVSWGRCDKRKTEISLSVAGTVSIMRHSSISRLKLQCQIR